MDLVCYHLLAFGMETIKLACKPWNFHKLVAKAIGDSIYICDLLTQTSWNFDSSCLFFSKQDLDIIYKTHLEIRHNMDIITYHSRPTPTLTWRVCSKMSLPDFTSEHLQQLWQPKARFKILSTLQTYLSNLSINHLGYTFPLIIVQQLVLISLFFSDHSNLTDYLLSNISLVLPLINIIDQVSDST